VEKQYLTEEKVSDITGIALSTLRNDRLYKRKIPYIKVGRSVRYDKDDVIKFMESCKIKTEPR
jgi:excisionase family DNA binding protein